MQLFDDKENAPYSGSTYSTPHKTPCAVTKGTRRHGDESLPTARCFTPSGRASPSSPSSGDASILPPATPCPVVEAVLSSPSEDRILSKLSSKRDTCALNALSSDATLVPPSPPGPPSVVAAAVCVGVDFRRPAASVRVAAAAAGPAAPCVKGRSSPSCRAFSPLPSGSRRKWRNSWDARSLAVREAAEAIRKPTAKASVRRAIIYHA